MKLLLDAMGGDNAPLALLCGAVRAASEYDVQIVLLGDEPLLRKTAAEAKLDLDLPNLSVLHTASRITMEDAPLSVVREKSDSSMAVGLKLLAAGKGDAFISAGNTGALQAGSALLVRRIKGIHRSALAAMLPFAVPVLLVDAGANVEVAPSDLVQFARMGVAYMKQYFEMDAPRVGLLNNGTEDRKGTKLLCETRQLLEAESSLSFVGNVEGKDVPFGCCDVLVTDGFTGNVFLKTAEGVSGFFLQKLKDAFAKNPVTRLSGILAKGSLRALKRDYTASEYGGAPLLGISKPVIKAHGNSDARAVQNAIRQAIGYLNTGVIVEIARQTRSAALAEADHAENATEEGVH